MLNNILAILMILLVNIVVIYLLNQKSKDGATKMQEMFGSRKVFFGFLVFTDATFLSITSFITSVQWIDITKFVLGFVVGGNLLEYVIKGMAKGSTNNDKT